ncbi:carboxymuconolactone decarboxylase family protein [Sulfitobacter sp.]|uniref:carboxymuconolactone decarboxylase family protein n=1 Tax=Sulfitobacter sp. TaxID=1903071 RepID=UPI003EF8FFED
MPFVKPLEFDATEEAQADIAWLASATGFTANSMLTLSHRPEIAKAVLDLIRAVVRTPDGTVDPALRWMVAHVTSLSNGCSYCSAHTFKNGADNGVPQEKLDAIWEFETSDLFSPAERVALRIAMTGGQCPSYATPEDMAELHKHFSDAQVVEIGSVIALFGFNNRWNALMATDVEPEVNKFLEESNYKGSKDARTSDAN